MIQFDDRASIFQMGKTGKPTNEEMVKQSFLDHGP